MAIGIHTSTFVGRSAEAVAANNKATLGLRHDRQNIAIQVKRRMWVGAHLEGSSSAWDGTTGASGLRR